MKDRIIGTLGILAVVTGMSMMYVPWVPAARYNGTTALMYGLPFLFLHPVIAVLTTGKRRGKS